MNAEKIVTGLTLLQADGLAYVVCGADYLRVHVAHVPVGWSGTGSQVFVCVGCRRPDDQHSEAGGVLRVACPPLALLLAVELLNRALKRHRAETASETTNGTDETNGTGDETTPVVRLAVVSGESRPPAVPTAEDRMWAYFQTERSQGRTPIGAELDRIADTNNYGRRVLR